MRLQCRAATNSCIYLYTKTIPGDACHMEIGPKPELHQDNVSWLGWLIYYIHLSYTQKVSLVHSLVHRVNWILVEITFVEYHIHTYAIHFLHVISMKLFPTVLIVWSVMLFWKLSYRYSLYHFIKNDMIYYFDSFRLMRKCLLDDNIASSTQSVSTRYMIQFSTSNFTKI